MLAAISWWPRSNRRPRILSKAIYTGWYPRRCVPRVRCWRNVHGRATHVRGIQTWKQRWCVLNTQTRELRLYKSHKQPRTDPHDTIGVQCSAHGSELAQLLPKGSGELGQVYAFEVNTPAQRHVFAAETRTAAERWVRTLCETAAGAGPSVAGKAGGETS